MSEKLLKVFLSELRTVRVVCRQRTNNGADACGGIVEVPIDKLPLVRSCPLCGNHLHPHADPRDNLFSMLSEAIGRLGSYPRVSLEFVLPDSPATPPARQDGKQ